MTKLQVSFHNMIGSGLLLAPAQGAKFRNGEIIAVYDDDTDTYAAEVIDQDGDTLVIRVTDKVLTEAK